MARLAPKNRWLAHDLVLGVRRRLFLIDAVLRRFLDRQLKSVAPPVLEALRCGVYDLLFNDRTPSAMIVSETVELAGRSRPLRGLVNAVLRNVAGGFEVETGDPAGEALDRHRVWLSGDRYARFEKAVLPDPKVDVVKHLSTMHSLTELFVGAFRTALPDEAEALFRACSARRSLAVRPRVGTSMDALRQAVEADGGTWLDVKGMVAEIHVEGAIGELVPLRDGLAVVQDLVAAEVAPFVAPEPGERVLDVCAPPGGKTVHLAELMHGEGEIVAAYPGASRIGRLQENVARLGLEDFVTLHDLGDGGDLWPDGTFDRVLVDAPCSNSGVLMKRVDARYRIQADELTRLQDLQLGLLTAAADRVREGGVLVHSTCSILPGENQGLVHRFLDDRSDFTLDEECLRYPHQTARDGGYVARLRRRS